MFRKDWESPDERRKRMSDGGVSGITSPALARGISSIGQSHSFTPQSANSIGALTKSQSFTPQAGNPRTRDDVLPSLASKNVTLSASEPENITASANIATNSTVVSTAVPSETPSCASSRGDSRRSSGHSNGAPGAPHRSPSGPHESPLWTSSAAGAVPPRRHSETAGGSTSRTGSYCGSGPDSRVGSPSGISRPGSSTGSRTPVAGRIRAGMSGDPQSPEIGPSSSQRPSSGSSCRAELASCSGPHPHHQPRAFDVPPLSSSEIDSNKKIEIARERLTLAIDARPRPPRTGWEIDSGRSSPTGSPKERGSPKSRDGRAGSPRLSKGIRRDGERTGGGDSPKSPRSPRDRDRRDRGDSPKSPRTRLPKDHSPALRDPHSPTTPSGSRDPKRPSGSNKYFFNNDNRPSSSGSTRKVGASDDSGSSSLLRHGHSTNARLNLRGGSRDDSFLSTISESTRSTDSTSTDRDSRINVLDGSQIEVYSENQTTEKGLQVDVLKDFNELFKHVLPKDSEQMQQLLRNHSFDKPLETQRRIIPLIMSAFQDEQKSFITVQGAPQCGKTSALALGILGALGSDMPGIRAIALSTGPVRDMKKCFDICNEVHPIRLVCFESTKRRVSFEGIDPDPDSSLNSVNLNEDMQRLQAELGTEKPGMIFGHPSRVLPLLREAPAAGVDISNVQVLALDDAEEAICQGLIDEVCEVCTILRHFSKQRLRHIILSHFLSNEAKSMVRCLRTSLLRQQNLFGIRAHRTQARAKAVTHFYAVAPRSRWPAMLAVLHHALSLPSGIIFDDESADARAHTRVALRSLGVTASVWNCLQEQRSGARAAARDSNANSSSSKSPAFHLMPSDLVVLKVDLPQVRCVLHFEVPRRELSIYGLRLMCLEQQEAKKNTRKTRDILGSKSLSVLFVEEAEVVRELEKTFHIRMHEVPTEMLPN